MKSITKAQIKSMKYLLASVRTILIFLPVFFLSFDAKTQSLKLSEFQFANTVHAADNGEYYPWIEFVNVSEESIKLSDYAVALCKACPQESLAGFLGESQQTKLVWFSGTALPGHLSLTLTDETKSIYLFNHEAMAPIDSIIIYSMPDINTSIARSPDADDWYYYPAEKVTPGVQNAMLNNWRKVLNNASFKIGDSGSFGCLVHHGYMYILDYETRDAVQWYDVAEVWRSDNGTEWQQINPTPPYKHWLTRFLSYEDSLYAFDGSAYRSYDGTTWEKIAMNLPNFSRMTIFKGKMYGLASNYLYTSEDGIHWTRITNDLPWYNRSNPALLTFNDKMWVYGGSINYGSGIYEFYYRDVWWSDDGVNWNMATNKAPWDGDTWFTYVAFDNKLWKIGGWNSFRELTGAYYGNSNAVWCSKDGVNWTPVHSPDGFSPRHAQFTWVYKDKLWIAAGYEGGGPSGLRNDVWRFEKLQQNLEVDFEDVVVENEIVQTYGDLPVALSVSSDSNLPISFYTENDTIVEVEDNFVNILNSGTDVLTVVQSGDPRFEEKKITIPVSISKKNLYVKAVDAEQTFLANPPLLTVEFEGFVNGDTRDDLDEAPFVTSPTDAFSPIGFYELVIQGGTDNNYKLNYTNGQLEVVALTGGPNVHVFPNPASQFTNIAFTEIQPSSCTVTLTSSSGRIIERYSMSGENSISIDVRSISPGFYFVQYAGCIVDETHRLVIK